MTNTTFTPPPPFDPELGAALAATGLESIATGITVDMLAAERAALLEDVPSVAEIAADSRPEVEERVVSGADGGPRVPLLIIRPADRPAGPPVVYTTHGAG
ncbi:hypothetical protein [Amycolatopsis sp. CA-126428]|uniref:hypothetical protein n=1 Tax=Amycolatopsis sp. CA-126428 TaxID=2073158 RepID=UPI001E54E7CE|nr:hypothetical protein [Amycolatopsis sp. CA-126428]